MPVKKKIQYVCMRCGDTWGKHEMLSGNFSRGRCDMCGRDTAIAKVKEFGGLREDA